MRIAVRKHTRHHGQIQVRSAIFRIVLSLRKNRGHLGTCKKTLDQSQKMNRTRPNQQHKIVMKNKKILKSIGFCFKTGACTKATGPAAKCPRSRITFILEGRRQNRSTSHIPSIWGTRARSERPPAGPEIYTEVLGNDKSTKNFRIFGPSKNASFSKNVRRVTRRDRTWLY